MPDIAIGFDAEVPSDQGNQKAQVAVAWKMLIRLDVMLRDGTDFPQFCRRGSHAGRLGGHLI